MLPGASPGVKHGRRHDRKPAAWPISFAELDDASDRFAASGKIVKRALREQARDGAG